MNEESAVVYCEGALGTMDGKTGNGMIRSSKKYRIVGVIDSTKAGRDSGDFINGERNGIPVFASLDHAMEGLPEVPKYFIYGIAPADAFLKKEERNLFYKAMEYGMNIVNPLQEFFSDDVGFVRHAKKHNVSIYDVRKPPDKKDMGLFTGRILNIKTPVAAVLGTDSAIGKRTTSVLLEEALINAGLNAVFIATGQTGLLQGAKYGVAIDAIPFQYMIGEIENEVMKAHDNEHPDIIIIEGQGAISHPAYISSCGIIRGARPGAIIVQHAPKRVNLGDFDFMKMPTLDSEIQLIETFSNSKVVAITLNHENMTETEVEDVIAEYEKRFNIPAADVLAQGCDKLITALFGIYPELKMKAAQTVSSK